MRAIPADISGLCHEDPILLESRDLHMHPNNMQFAYSKHIILADLKSPQRIDNIITYMLDQCLLNIYN